MELFERSLLKSVMAIITKCGSLIYYEKRLIQRVMAILLLSATVLLRRVTGVIALSIPSPSTPSSRAFVGFLTTFPVPGKGLCPGVWHRQRKTFSVFKILTFFVVYF